MNTLRQTLLLAATIAIAAAGCGGDDGNEFVTSDDCVGIIVDGACIPAAPQSTATDDCPSGQYLEADHFAGEGICAPAAPQLGDWDCPENWVPIPVFTDAAGTARVPDGIAQYTYCEPPPLAEGCGEGEAPLPGYTACERLGAECPTEDPWIEEGTLVDLAPGFEADVVYVDINADPGGDGSRGRPYASIGDAIADASAGDIVAVGPGEYAEEVVLSEEIALVGACVEETIITAPTPSNAPVVTIDDRGGALVRDISITGDRPGIRVRGTATPSHIEAVRVFSAQTRGIAVNEGAADVTMRRVHVTNTRPQPIDEAFGIGLVVAEGSSATLDECVFTRNRMFAVAAIDPGTTVSVARSVLRATQAELSSEAWGFGLSVEAGAAVTMSESLLSANQIMSANISSLTTPEGEAPTSLDMSNVVIADTQFRRATGESGRGLNIVAGAEVRLDQVAIVRSREVGLFIESGTDPTPASPSTLEARRLLVAHTVPIEGIDLLGRGIVMQNGAQATLRELAVVNNYEAGLFVTSYIDEQPTPQTSLTLEDFAIVDTLPEAASGDDGAGMLMGQGADAAMTRGFVARNHAVGVQLFSLPRFGNPVVSVFDLEDVWIADTIPQPEGDVFGYGLQGTDGVEINVRRVRVTGSRTLGVLMDSLRIDGRRPASTLSAVDLIVTDTQLAPSDVEGAGMQVSNGAVVELERAVFARNRTAGIQLLETVDAGFPEPPQLYGSDVVVADTMSDSAGEFGYGLVGAGVAVVDLDRVVVADNESAGVLALGGESTTTVEPGSEERAARANVSLMNAYVSGNAMGAVANDGASVLLIDFAVRDNSGVGVHGGDDAAAEGQRGRVSGNGAASGGSTTFENVDESGNAGAGGDAVELAAPAGNDDSV